ncbi:leucine-rich repeat and guanylate kinase domain-containing protein-like [Colias croceus]|uniref:leucine-rich repeat and guanylate kinase domain-containing protein-like n=1 Tax=Colias crocea TaxID=72248 RepID=UPI001E27C4B3|nr:leucine-rich repeat and guanylate kinase domain-containing protein-like [Colias croceus]
MSSGSNSLENAKLGDEKKLSSSMRFVPFGSLLKTWTEVSRINYMSALALDDMSRDQRFKSFSLPLKKISIPLFDPSKFQNKDEESELIEQFPINVTPLMNEHQLWGCFYNFPELYEDVYSPIVHIRNVSDIPDIEGGVLTRDLVSTCLSYLKRSPILGDYVYIKLDLSSKYLHNIDVLKNYKYLVYLDLSSNLLDDLSVLSYLLYIQFLNVSFNSFRTVLDYDTPQWFLTEVHYRYNSVTKIRDLSAFWSITVIDLSHNNIKSINGLDTLRYLRRLDLSFNHIQRFENLNHLRLLWLDLSYNNISDFEFGDDVGLWTLLHLEYLNLNENNLTSMKIFSGCSRFRELHIRNNRLGSLLELAVYMSKLRRLTVLDFRSNPMCSVPGYKDVVINTFPLLLCLDDIDLDPVEQRTFKMNMKPDIFMFASRRLLRLMYIEQMSRARVSPYNPPADTTDVPIIVFVGYEAVGKGRSGFRYSLKIRTCLASRRIVTFDEMLLDGEFLTYSEMDSESYGLSRSEAFVKDGKVKIVTMDLLGALMLKLRGRQPYLILTTCSDKRALATRQQERKIARDLSNEEKMCAQSLMEISTLQVLLSGRIIINGILNEILQAIPEDKSQSEFIMESECSLLMESESRKPRKYIKNVNRLTMLTPSSSLGDVCKSDRDKNSSQVDSSLYSLYKETQPMDEYTSTVYGHASSVDRGRAKTRYSRYSSRPKSFDTKQTSLKVGSRKSSKSVAFTSPENTDLATEESDPSGLYIEPVPQKENKVPRHESKLDDPDFFKMQLDTLKELPSGTFTTTIKDDYDEIHRTCPGLFWDTVTMDNPDKAFKKMKKIIQNIVNSQKNLKPMFDVDFTSPKYLPAIKDKLATIVTQIAPQRLFY